jgi:hypothetical protein
MTVATIPPQSTHPSAQAPASPDPQPIGTPLLCALSVLAAALVLIPKPPAFVLIPEPPPFPNKPTQSAIRRPTIANSHISHFQTNPPTPIPTQKPNPQSAPPPIKPTQPILSQQARRRPQCDQTRPNATSPQKHNSHPPILPAPDLSSVSQSLVCFQNNQNIV